MQQSGTRISTSKSGSPHRGPQHKHPFHSKEIRKPSSSPGTTILEMDLSDYDPVELADETYDDLDHNTATGKRSPKEGAGYQLTNVLKLPRATTYSTQALYDQVHAGDIDLEPEYQRDVVWPESKQIGLVDSILRNFYVPPIIFVSHQHDDGSETKTCIDGKQRLTSIHRLTGKKHWYKIASNIQSDRKQLLPERYRRLFANKQVVCIEYQDLPDSDEREIFQASIVYLTGMSHTDVARPSEYNSGWPSPPQVVNTPMSSFVRKIQAEYFSMGSPLDAEGFDWDRSRGGDFRCITQALYVIAKYPSTFSLGAIVQLEKWLHKPTIKPYKRTTKKKVVDDDVEDDLSQDEAYLERVHSTFATFSKLVGDMSYHPFFLRPEWRVSPIEFVMMCLLISVEKDRMTLPELATKIGELRAHVRNEHMDIRMNNRVATTMFDFIKQISNSSSPRASEPGGKRKREEDDDVALLTRKEKERRGDEVGSGLQSQASSVLPPPRPDRRSAAAPDMKKAIAPPRVTPLQINTPHAAVTSR
ncbi:hypothetical protein JVU11DRAFT_7111 [Chiua virens]|nr:hypothetical protein JVU11DRAFT_7111 [Chiua virens]